MRNEPLSLATALASFDDLWSPRIAARVNDYDVRVTKVRGEHVWHVHDDTDEFFLVLDGELYIALREPAGERTVHLPAAPSSPSRAAPSTARPPRRRLDPPVRAHRHVHGRRPPRRGPVPRRRDDRPRAGPLRPLSAGRAPPAPTASTTLVTVAATAVPRGPGAPGSPTTGRSPSPAHQAHGERAAVVRVGLRPRLEVAGVLGEEERHVREAVKVQRAAREVRERGDPGGLLGSGTRGRGARGQGGSSPLRARTRPAYVIPAQAGSARARITIPTRVATVSGRDAPRRRRSRRPRRRPGRRGRRGLRGSWSPGRRRAR